MGLFRRLIRNVLMNTTVFPTSDTTNIAVSTAVLIALVIIGT